MLMDYCLVTLMAIPTDSRTHLHLATTIHWLMVMNSPRHWGYHSGNCSDSTTDCSTGWRWVRNLATRSESSKGKQMGCLMDWHLDCR